MRERLARVWNVGQYQKFRGDRAQPFFDLVARLPLRDFATIVDLGCGAGDLTQLLGERYPAARILGVDNSEQMLAAAQTRSIPDRLEFVLGDIESFTGGPYDLVFSNAALHWLPNHGELLERLSSLLAPDGVLAVQMPSNFHAPSHTIVADLFAKRFAGPPSIAPVAPAADYVTRLWQLSFSVSAWETTYFHVLGGEDPVLEWLRGTTLLPLLRALSPEQRQDFLSECAALLRLAYPATDHGTLFPFKRVFFVATRA